MKNDSDLSAGPIDAAWNTRLLILALAIPIVGVASPFLFGSSPLAVAATLLTFAFVHGTLRYGGINIGILFVLAVVTGNVYENMSVLTGFPFGHYHWNVGPKLFHAPVLVGVNYFSIGYCAWQVASFLLDEADRRMTRPVERFSLPILAAFVMTMIDVSLDPTASTVSGAWTWEQGGGYYGVPYTNFLGWLLTTWTFFQLFALRLAFCKHPVRPMVGQTGLVVAPTLVYAGIALFVLTLAFKNMASDATIADAAGIKWRRADIGEAALLTTIFTQLFVVVLVGFRLVQLRPPRKSLV